MAQDAKEIRQAEREEKRDEKARLRQEKTDAYIAKEDEQTALYAENEALAAPFSDTDTDGTGPDTDTDGPIPPDVQRVIDANNARIELLEEEINKIYSSTLGFVAGRSRKQRLEDMVGYASGAEAAKAAPKEQIAELKADTEVLAAQHLLEHNLLPADLKAGPNMKQAARLVGRPDATPAELSAFADLIQPAYDIESSLKKAAEDKEKGVVVGRTMDTIKEIASNPAKMGGAALGLFGAWLLYGALKGHGPEDGTKTWIKGILGGLGLLGGVAVVTGAWSPKNIGLGDALESVTGHRADEFFSSESMDQVRALFDGMPGMDSGDTDVVDNFISITNGSIGAVAGAFREAVGKGATKIQKSRLGGSGGLSSKESKFVDEGSLYTSCSWFFMQCYEQGLAKGECPVATDEKSKLLFGANWAEKNFAGHQVGSCIAALELVRMGSAGAAETGTRAVETSITNPALAKLEKQVPSFGRLLVPTTVPDVYLINGYPVRYNHTDAGGHIFTDVLPPTQPFTPVDAVLTGDALEVTLAGISTDALERARAAYAAIPGVAPRAVKYNERGHWELEPPEKRVAHAGLPNYLRGPADAKVPVILYYDAVENKLRIGKDQDKDGVPDPRDVPYDSVDDVANEFERGILEGLIKKDIDHVLLGVPFAVGDKAWTDPGPTPATTTEITITYGNNAKGTMTYKDDALESYTLQPDAALETVWNTTAEKRIADFLNTPLVQTELLKATGAFTPNNLSGWMTSIGKFFGNGIQWLKDDSIMAQFRNDWEKQVITKMKELVYHPTDGLAVDYVDTLFRNTPPTTPTPTPPATPTTGILKNKFDTAERTFFALKLGDIQGKVTATVAPEKEPDYQLNITQAIDKARGDGAAAIAIALAPLKDRVPATMPSRFASAAQSIGNLFTGDAARTELYEKEAGKWQKELEKRVSALFLIPSGPVPAGSPSLAPTVPTKDQVQQEIDRIQVEAQREALGYVGLNNQDAVKELLLAPAKNAHPEWKAASELVALYITNNMKWEKYGFIPNPENMAQIMDLWYKNTELDTVTTAPQTTHPDLYAKYFIWELQIRMGGHQDFSPEYFYGDVQSVSDTNFKGMITSLTAEIKPFSNWTTPLDTRPATPDMLPSIDIHRENLKVRFNTWFEKNADCGALFKLDHYWPQVFEGSVKDRFAQIISNPSATPATLDQDVKDFTQWVWLERYMVMEPLMLNRVEAERKGFDIRVKIFNKFPKYFYPEANRTANYPRYEMMIKQQMRDIMSSHHTFPNMPGVPFL